mmetsp:Transcript_30486/g.98262  ORF Transcript_30486/g.98262 Transcript_30486/m.98262 type:complete len:226 (+) Transcript_30486:2532-3209(+)
MLPLLRLRWRLLGWMRLLKIGGSCWLLQGWGLRGRRQALPWLLVVGVHWSMHRVKVLLGEVRLMREMWALMRETRRRSMGMGRRMRIPRRRAVSMGVRWGRTLVGHEWRSTRAQRILGICRGPRTRHVPPAVHVVGNMSTTSVGVETWCIPEPGRLEIFSTPALSPTIDAGICSCPSSSSCPSIRPSRRRHMVKFCTRSSSRGRRISIETTLRLRVKFHRGGWAI